MTSLNQTPAIRARLVLAEEKQARKIADILAETFDGDEVAVAVFETSAAVSPAGAHAAPHVVAEGPRLWELCAYFGSAPNEDHIRALIAMATDATVARETRFEATEERDWVQASLEGLPPVEAGRFIVHGHHDRAQVAPNRIGIEIEAALAFGTESVPAVNKIVGPGNAFVNEAKRQVFGPVGIDQLAGPSEIFIIADSTGDAEMIATDMLAQAGFSHAQAWTDERGWFAVVHAQP